MYISHLFLFINLLNSVKILSAVFSTPIIRNGTLNINVQRKCPDGWASFQRQKGLYCIKVFYPPPYWYTQPQAQAMCNEIGARLAGIETIAERNYIARVAANYMTNMSLTSTVVWIGAYRVLQCTKSNVIVDKCSNTRYAFTWSDGNVVGDDQMLFRDTGNSGTGQQCVQMTILAFPEAPQMSLYDDISCDGTVETWVPNHYAQYVCGQQAPIVGFDTY